MQEKRQNKKRQTSKSAVTEPVSEIQGLKEIIFHKKFKDDVDEHLRKGQITDSGYERIETLIDYLKRGAQLPRGYRSHKSKGKHFKKINKNIKSCRITGDVRVWYYVKKDHCQIRKIGKHPDYKDKK